MFPVITGWENANNRLHLPKCCIKNMYIKVVIPAVLKRESRNKVTGCPIENLGQDEKYSNQNLTPGELLILTLIQTHYVKNPAAETAGRQKLNICFQCHSRLSGILLTFSESQERFWTDPRQSEDKSQNDKIRNCGRDRRV